MHERNGKLTQGLIVEAHQKLDELARALNEADSSRKKLQVENQDLTRQIEETESAIATLGKNKISLTTQLEDTKRMGDAEARDRASLLSKFKSLNTELEGLKDRIDEENRRNLMLLRDCPRLRLKFSCGGPSTRLRWKISSLNMRESMLLPLSLRREERTLTRLLVNGRQRLMTCLLKLMPARRSAETITASCSALRLHGMRLLSSWMLSRGKTRTWLMKSRTFLTNWEMEAGPSMSLTSSAGAWKLRRKSSRLLLRKPRLLLNKRKTRSCVLSLSLAKLGRKLTGRFKRRKKSSTIPVRTMQELWTPCKPPWKLNPELRLKLFALRRSWNLTSMSLKLLLTMPTRPMLRPRSLSSVTRTNFVKLKEPLRRSTANMSKSLRRQDLLSARPMHFMESLKSPGLCWTLPIGARSSARWNSPRPGLLLMT